MAALAVGHVLRLPLETMLDPMRSYFAGPHRCEIIAEINGVQFINDAKCTNVDALRKALMSTRVYRDAWTHDDAMELLRRETGTAFDERCVDALEQVVTGERELVAV